MGTSSGSTPSPPLPPSCQLSDRLPAGGCWTVFDMKSWREKGRECGRIRGCVGVEDIFIVFFPTLWQGCVFSVMPLRIISSKYVKWGREIENTYKGGKDFGKYLSLLLALTSLTYITLFYLFINSNIHHMCLHHFSANDKSHTTLFTLTTMSLSSYSCAKCPGCLLPTYPTIYFK